MFRNRKQAAQQLAERLAVYQGQNPLVLAIPRGAVPMAEIISHRLQGELDVVLVRKLRHPQQRELAIGSIDELGNAVISEYARKLEIPETYIEQEKREQLATLKKRRQLYAKDGAAANPAGRIVIVVDDGIATGSTVIAALRSLRAQKPKKLIVATAVAPVASLAKIKPYADDIVCLETPSEFYAVGQFFEDFSQVSDEEVCEILKRPQARSLADPEVMIPVDRKTLRGDLTIPEDATGLVLFVHGSGSGRLSPRNRYVAEVLQKSGIATLLFDLLTPEEDQVYETRFNIPLLTRRLVAVTQWVEQQPNLTSLKLSYFGASTGAAAALMAAAEFGTKIAAVVSRGGRPDLAAAELHRVRAPTLLIVGGLDDVVIGMNQSAYDQLPCIKKLAIVSGATHLFEEPGTLERAARLAADWLQKYGCV